jgi:hypothetical protein
MTPLLWPLWCAATSLSFSSTTTDSDGYRRSTAQQHIATDIARQLATMQARRAKSCGDEMTTQATDSSEPSAGALYLLALLRCR